MRPHALIPTCFLLAAALTGAPDARAQAAFGEADLDGRYAFGASTEAGESLPSSNYGLLTMVGSLTFDGAGAVTGRRTLRRPLHRLADGLTLNATEELDQELVGSYSVLPDGRGEILLTASPNPVWAHSSRTGEEIVFEDRVESWAFSISEGRCRLDLSIELVGARADGAWDWKVPFVGTAERHDDGCGDEPDPRLDELLERNADLADRVDELTRLVERQGAQLCELLRLMHVPQGRRESAGPEVIEACGRDYSWNEDR